MLKLEIIFKIVLIKKYVEILSSIHFNINKKL